ncbi:glycosyltransferase [Phenylobacterium sp. J367]|uniref:glycosyltransferase n=1 Tax=Phenylobacterium sp. J367 TaxID=2898435 RepID=UPI0021512EDD|nr:glycosyltransferase [Phenylobacterium sp. J367]MCR5877552.1 glycosyltransferase [Phenylobacterium sp. J367]
MRILYVVHQFFPEFSGGTEQVTLNHAKAAQRDGAYAEVLTVTVGEAPKVPAYTVDGVPVHVIGQAVGDALLQLGYGEEAALKRRVERYLDSRPPFDAVHVMHAFRLVEAVEVLAERRIPYAVTLTDFFSICHRINLIRVNGDLCAGPEGGAACAAFCTIPEAAPEAYAARYERLTGLLRQASAVVAVSEYVAGRIRDQVPGLKVLVVGNGVDLLRFGPPKKRPADRPLTFGYLGTVSEAKGAGVLAEGFARAAPEGAVLRIVGPCYDDALAARLRGLGPSISLEGPVKADDVPDVLAGFDILCVPSQVPEAFSLSLHEGFAAGLPALVSDIGNVAAVVAKHRCGRTVKATSVEAWAEAITFAASKPKTVANWRKALPLPLRSEEEAFFYSQIYRGLARLRAAA